MTAALTEGELAVDADGSAAPRRPRWLVAGLAVLAAVLLLRLFVAEPMRAHGDSMEPTIHDGDAIVVDRLTYRFSEPEVGDVVVAHAPDTGQSVVKRVVALGGETIEIYDGLLRRNGIPVDEPYVDYDQTAGLFWGPVTVPEGTVFLLGDNRRASVDSRSFGAVAIDEIVGRYRVTFWPL